MFFLQLQHQWRVDSAEEDVHDQEDQARLTPAGLSSCPDGRIVRQKVRRLDAERSKRSKNETSTETEGRFLTPRLPAAGASRWNHRLIIFPLQFYSEQIIFELICSTRKNQIYLQSWSPKNPFQKWFPLSHLQQKSTQIDDSETIPVKKKL